MRFVQELPSQFQNKNSSSAKTQFLNSLKKGGKKPNEKTSEERYQEILKEKMDEVRTKAASGGKYAFHLPGTDASDCRELSQGAQDILQRIAEKKAKKEEKKRKKEEGVSVKAKYFTGMQGGRIDNKGRIYDSKGQCILVVDAKTGNIKNKQTGCVVGKYKSGCGYSEHRICELISKYDTTKRAGWHAGTAGHSAAGGNVWGSSASGGDIWGNGASKGGGNIWGNAPKDSNGWW